MPYIAPGYFPSAYLPGSFYSGYTSSGTLGLRRGIKSSPYTAHGASEKFVHITNNVVRIPVNSAFVGTTVQVKVVAIGQLLSDVTPVNVVITAKGQTADEAAIDAINSTLSSRKESRTLYISGINPSGTGYILETMILPKLNGAAANWKLKRFLVRSEGQTGNGATSLIVHLDYFTGNTFIGSVTPVNQLSGTTLTLYPQASDYITEASTTSFVAGTLASDGKLAIYISQEGWVDQLYFGVEIEEA